MVQFKKHLDFGIIDSSEKKRKILTLTNNSVLPVKINSIIFNTEHYTAIYDNSIIPGIMPPNSTIYYGPHGEIIDDNGNYYTENQDNGIFGYTDSSSNVTIVNINPILEIISITDPLLFEGLFEDGTDYYFDTTTETLTTSWTEYYVGTGNSDGDLVLDWTEA